MPNPAWGGQGVLRNTTGSAVTVSYEMGVKVQNSEVAIYVQWYEKTDLNSDERKYRVNGTNIETVSPKQPTFAPYWTQDAAAAWRFQSCGKKSYSVQDLIDSDKLQQLHHQVWGRMLDKGKTIKAVMRVGSTKNAVLYGRRTSRIVTLHLVGAIYNAYNFFILHFCT